MPDRAIYEKNPSASDVRYNEMVLLYFLHAITAASLAKNPMLKRFSIRS
jgi:hypothetical protein